MTDGGSAWEDLWKRLNDFFGVLVDELRACNQHVGRLPWHHQTTAFPFRGGVSLCKIAPSFDEDLVLTWSVAWRGDYLIVTADVVRGDGTVLAEAVPAELREPVSPSKLFAELERAMRFFRDSMDLIKREVC